MIKFNFNFTYRPNIDTLDDHTADHQPKYRSKKIPKDEFLENIYLRHGQFIHDLVVNYMEMPEIEIVDIAREANVSKQRAHQWLTRVHGTTKKKRLKKSCKTKQAKPWELIPELKQFKLTRIKGSIQNFYTISQNNRKVLIRKSLRHHQPPNSYYVTFQTDRSSDPSLIVLIVNGDAYIFPPPPYRKKTLIIPFKKLAPYKNKFEYLLNPIETIPKIKNDRFNNRYRGVFKSGDVYSVSIYVNRERFRFGKYKTDIEAAKAYDQAVLYFCPKVIKTNGLEDEPFDEIEISKLIRG